MPPDIKKYRCYVDHFDISEDQKIELIHTVWNMMQSFVDRAFGNDPTQHAMAIKALENGTQSQKMIECSHHSKQDKKHSKSPKKER